MSESAEKQDVQPLSPVEHDCAALLNQSLENLYLMNYDDTDA